MHGHSLPRSSRGISLIELMIVIALFSIIMVLLGSILLSSTRSMDYLVKDSTSDSQMKNALYQIFGELKSSNPSMVRISTADPDHDAITFQTPGPYLDGVQWGAMDDSGIWKADWSAQYLVVDGNLVRRVLDDGGQSVGSNKPIVLHVDGQRDGRKGFYLATKGPVINVGIRIWKTFSDGGSYQKEFSSSVFLRNCNS